MGIHLIAIYSRDGNGEENETQIFNYYLMYV